MEDVIVKLKREDFTPSSNGEVHLSPNFFCILPQDVMQDKELSASEKLMYALVTSLCHVKGYCWANNSFFEQYFDKSESAIRTWLNSLKNKNYIMIEFIIDLGTNEQLERRIYPMMNIEQLRRLAKNSIMGSRSKN